MVVHGSVPEVKLLLPLTGRHTIRRTPAMVPIRSRGFFALHPYEVLRAISCAKQNVREWAERL